MISRQTQKQLCIYCKNSYSHSHATCFGRAAIFSHVFTNVYKAKLDMLDDSRKVETCSIIM